MFTLFFSMVVAMFTGDWYLYDFQEMSVLVKEPFGKVIEIITSLFNNVDSAVTNVDGLMGMFHGAPYFVYLVSAIIALVISIGIILVALKVVKRLFTILFTLGR